MGCIRIVSGSLKGRKLQTPPGDATRPLLTRLRKSLIDILRPRLAGACVLDLFGGSGAIAFECLSNGASRAVVVELHSQTALLIRQNAHSLGIDAAVEVRCGDGISAIAGFEDRDEKFDIIIVAPPYGHALQQKALLQLSGAPVLAGGGVVVVQRESHEPFIEPAGGLVHVSTRSYGRTVFDFYAGRYFQEQ
jgi:16S rRNA (guanine966-N2)-methyltransferase